MDFGDIDQDQQGFDTLKINEKFAARFEHNERRKMLEKNKHLLD